MYRQKTTQQLADVLSQHGANIIVLGEMRLKGTRFLEKSEYIVSYIGHTVNYGVEVGVLVSNK